MNGCWEDKNRMEWRGKELEDRDTECYNFRIYSAISLYSRSVLSKWQYSTVVSPSSRFNLSA